MKLKYSGSLFFFLHFFLLTATQQALALQYGCRLTPKDAVAMTDRLIQKFYKNSEGSAEPRYLPNNLPINTEIQQEVDPKTNQANDHVQYEAILRPKKTDYFPLQNIMLFKLERSRNLMYVCFNHNSKKPEENHLTIYFMSAYGLEPASANRDDLTTIPGDWFFGPGGLFQGISGSVTELTRVPIEIIPVDYIAKDVSDWTESIPILRNIIQVPVTGLNFTAEFLALINRTLGAGVERIVITANEIEFSNSVDLDNPEKANVLYRLKLVEPWAK
ncbi:MAG: hypothetical protein ACXWRE_04665 [Pseudobdellovibrionaceae bacterium]